MSENESRQQTGNKYGINRDRIKKAKGVPFFGGMKNQNKPEEQDGQKKRFKLDLYQKVVIVLTVLASLAYCGVYALNQKGYMLINTTIQYWLWFAVIICVILLVGRFVMKLPKRPLSIKSTKICVAVVSIIFIFMTYLSCVEGIDASWRQCAEIHSEDGKNSVIVMRIDVDIPENASASVASEEAAPAEEAAVSEDEDVSSDETAIAKSYTLYSAYPRINSLFCDSSAQDNLIMLENGKDEELKMEWIDGDLKLYVEEKALDGMESIMVVFE